MPLTFLPAAARSPKPWKNGGGVTTDVWVWPEGAGLDDFLARVSIAEVASDGPFSLFAGIDRSTAIFAGGGFDLTFDGVETHRLERDAPPLSYSGDRPAASRLIAGPTTDLNAMSRRGRMTHAMERHDLRAPLSLTPPGMTLLLVSEGEGTITSGGQTFRLAASDACVMTQADGIFAPATTATVWLVRFVPAR